MLLFNRDKLWHHQHDNDYYMKIRLVYVTVDKDSIYRKHTFHLVSVMIDFPAINQMKTLCNRITSLIQRKQSGRLQTYVQVYVCVSVCVCADRAGTLAGGSWRAITNHAEPRPPPLSGWCFVQVSASQFAPERIRIPHTHVISCLY